MTWLIDAGARLLTAAVLAFVGLRLIRAVRNGAGRSMERAGMEISLRKFLDALLYALLLPNDKLRELQESARFTELMVLQEEVKMLPFGDVWEAYLESCGLSESFYPQVAEYEKKVLSKRK